MSEKNEELFTQEELNEIKQRLLEEIEEITKSSSETLNDLQKLGCDEFSDPSDRAYLESERNLNLRIKDRERKLIGKINRIIQRINDGEYQDCIQCGNTINKNRLLARPVTDLCVSCKEIQEQEERNSKI